MVSGRIIFRHRYFSDIIRNSCMETYVSYFKIISVQYVAVCAKSLLA